MLLVLRGTPATIDEEPDPVVRCILGGSAQGVEERWIEVGYSRNLPVEDRRAARDGAVGLAERTAVLTAKSGSSLRTAPTGGGVTVEDEDAAEDAAEDEEADNW